MTAPQFKVMTPAITAAQFRDEREAVKTERPSKYRAVKTTIDGIEFHSAGEAKRYAQLKLEQRAGLISGLTTQPEFPIVINDKPLRIRSKRGVGKPIKAIMDFEYVRDGVRCVEDFKGFDTDVSRLKRALVEAIYGVTVTVTGKTS